MERSPCVNTTTLFSVVAERRFAYQSYIDTMQNASLNQPSDVSTLMTETSLPSQSFPIGPVSSCWARMCSESLSFRFPCCVPFPRQPCLSFSRLLPSFHSHVVDQAMILGGPTWHLWQIGIS